MIRLWHSKSEAALPAEVLARVRDGPIVHVVINRPRKRNALTAEIWKGLRDLMPRLGDDPGVKLVVLRGSGTMAFTAGADIDEFPVVYADPEKTRLYNDAVREAQLAVERFDNRRSPSSGARALAAVAVLRSPAISASRRRTQVLP